jgi:hypothetical protein
MQQEIDVALADLRAYLAELIKTRKEIAERIARDDHQPETLRIFNGLKNIEEVTDRNIRRLENAHARNDHRSVMLSLLPLPGDARFFDYSGGFELEKHKRMHAAYHRASVSVSQALDAFRLDSGRLP